MKMREVVAAAPTQLHLPKDHMTSSNCSTPYMSAASSPQRPRQLDFFFYSAPTSPRSSSSYLDDHFSYFDDDVAVLDRDYATDHVPLLSHRPSSSATVPFNWELKPGVVKTTICSNDNRNEDGHQPQKLGGKEQSNKDEFEFDFSGQLDMMVRPSLSSADELFDGGKIRPLKLKLKPPPSLHINNNHADNRIGSESPTSKFKGACALRRKASEKQDPFEAAIRNTRKADSGFKEDDNVSQDRGRGRGRVNSNTNTNTNTSKRGGNSGRKGISRSLSPLRVSEFALLQHQQYLEEQQNSNETSNNNCSRLFGRIPSSSTCSSRKWKLKDLLLFRSASEGHYKDTQSFSKRWSFRSSNTIGSGSGSGSVTESGSGSVSKRRGQGASAHEMHYATNKAASEEMKRKTSLPYKHGLLACLGFSPILPQFSYTFPSSPSTPLS